MPSKSDKQHRLMEAVKHNPKFAKKVGIPQSVGRDYVAADKRTGRYAGGGKVGKAKSALGEILRGWADRDFRETMSDDALDFPPQPTRPKKIVPNKPPKRGSYARGGSVLKALAEPRMRPVKPVGMPELREADRTISRAGERLRKLKRG